MKQALKKILNTLTGFILSLRKSRVEADGIKKVLIISLYFRGDVLFNTPVIKVLNEILNGAEIDVWVKSRSKEILEYNPNVRRVIVFDNLKTSDTENVSRRGLLSFIKSIRNENYDLCIDLTGKYSTALIALFGNFRKSIGINYHGFGFCYTKYVPLDTSGTKGHLVDKYLSVVKQGFDIGNSEWRGIIEKTGSKTEMYPSPRAEGIINAELSARGIDSSKPLILLHTTAGWQAKEWHESGYFDVIKQLTARGYNVLIIGGDSDKIKAGKIQRYDIESAFALEDIFISLPLNIISELIKRADVFIGGDSVPVHIADSFERPVVALFGPTNPGFSMPRNRKAVVIYNVLSCSAAESSQYCTRDAGKTCPFTACMHEISAENVIDTVERLLQKYYSAPLSERNLLCRSV